MSINANNAALNEILEAINELPNSKEEQDKIVDITENGETVVTPDDDTTTLSKVTVNVTVPEQKEEQEKIIDITENGTTEVLPDEGKALSKVTVNVEIESGESGDPYEVINSIFDGTITEFYSLKNFVGSRGTQLWGTLFNECYELTKWAMPNNTRDLSYAFRYCDILKYVDIGKPASCGVATFYGANLRGMSVVVRAETPPKLTGTFTGTNLDNTTVFYVPKNSIEAYRTATNWSAYADHYKAIEDYPEITGGII